MSISKFLWYSAASFAIRFGWVYTNFRISSFFVWVSNRSYFSLTKSYFKLSISALVLSCSNCKVRIFLQFSLMDRSCRSISSFDPSLLASSSATSLTSTPATRASYFTIYPLTPLSRSITEMVAEHNLKKCLWDSPGDYFSSCILKKTSKASSFLIFSKNRAQFFSAYFRLVIIQRRILRKDSAETLKFFCFLSRIFFCQSSITNPARPYRTSPMGMLTISQQFLTSRVDEGRRMRILVLGGEAGSFWLEGRETRLWEWRVVRLAALMLRRVGSRCPFVELSSFYYNFQKLFKFCFRGLDLGIGSWFSLDIARFSFNL